MLEAPRPAGHVTGKGCPTTDPSTRRQALDLDQPGAGPASSASTSTCRRVRESFPGQKQPGAPGATGTGVRICSPSPVVVLCCDRMTGTAPGAAPEVPGTDRTRPDQCPCGPLLALGAGHQHQEAGPRPRSARRRPGPQRQHLDGQKGERRLSGSKTAGGAGGDGDRSTYLFAVARGCSLLRSDDGDSAGGSA